MKPTRGRKNKKQQKYAPKRKWKTLNNNEVLKTEKNENEKKGLKKEKYEKSNLTNVRNKSIKFFKNNILSPKSGRVKYKVIK